MIKGVVSGLSSTNTLNGADVIDGGAGTDTLSVNMTANFSGMTADVGSVTNVEVLDITNGSSLTRSFDTTGISGLKTVKVDTNDQAFTVADLESTNLRVELSNADEAKTVTLTYATLNGTSVNAGTSDSLALALNDVGTAEVKNAAGTVTTAQKTLAVVAAGIEDLTIESNGTSNFVNASIGTSKTLTTTGAADLNVTAVDSTLTQVDGSAATGDLTLDLTAGGAFTSIKTGTGDDSVTVDTLNVEAVIAGGAGADTLVLKNLAAGTYQPAMTGFETIKLEGQANAITIAGNASSDLATIEVLNGLAAVATMTFAEFNNSAVNINFVDTKGAADVTGTAGTISYTSAADVTINATTNNAAGSTRTYEDAVTAANATSVALNVAKDVVFKGAVTAAKATSATIDVAKGGSLTTGAFDVAKASTVSITANGTMSSAVNAAEATSVDMTLGADSAFTSKVTAAKATTVNVVSNDTGAIQFDIITDKATTVDINTKSATTFAGTTDFSSVQTMNLASTNSVNTTGAAALGDKSSAVTIDASGVKGAFNTNVSAYAAGGGSLTVVGSTLAANTIAVSAGRNEISITGGIGADVITLNQVFTSNDEVSMSFDLGTVSTTDSVSFAAGANITNGTTTFAGVDTVIALGTLAANAASFSGQDIAITAGGLITLSGTANADTIDLDGIKTSANGYTLNAGDGNDTITGSAAMTGTQTINGDAGNDTITIGAYAATVNGGAGNDTIIGGAGADIIAGGAGNDIIKLGASKTTDGDVVSLKDINAAADADTIYGFTTTDDTIILTNTSGAASAAPTALVNIAGIAGLAITNVIADTAANLGASGVSIGDQSAVFTNGGYAFETDTGKLYFDADGDFTSGVVLVGTIYATDDATTVATMVAGDFLFA